MRFCTTILRLHKSHLDIHSEGEDRGSTFAFALPSVQRHTQNPSPQDAGFDLESSVQNLALSTEIKAHWQPYLVQLQSLDLYDAELGDILQAIEKNHEESHITVQLFKECIKLDEENLYQTLLSKLSL
ncbi:MAG: hypothetical protein NW226_21195 [Microscillaceae bacterium]|nr:hypothetical protein [Microscillaceae bacterium]